MGCETAREARRSERGNIDGAMICTKRCLGGREAWERRYDVAPLPQISRLIFGPGENGFSSQVWARDNLHFPITIMDFMCRDIAQSTALYAAVRKESFQ